MYQVKLSETIAKQKEYTLKLLEIIDSVFDHYVCAGGAPRNWYMGRAARDIDIWVQAPIVDVPLHLIIEVAVRFNERTGKHVQYTLQFNLGGYNTNIKIGCVYLLKCEDMEFQIIFTNIDGRDYERSIVTHFDTDINCIVYTKLGEYIDYGCYEAVRSKTIKFRCSHLTDYQIKHSQGHVNKMIEYFPDFTFVNI